jgi:hypothetical protein
MKVTVKNKHHTEIECQNGNVAVNTADGIQLQVTGGPPDDFGAFIDLRREEARELVRLLTEALT